MTTGLIVLTMTFVLGFIAGMAFYRWRERREHTSFRLPTINNMELLKRWPHQ